MEELAMQFKKSFQPVIYFILGLFACCLTVSFVHADQLSKQIDHMSLQDKIAQMYFVPSDGNQNDVLNAIQQYHVGGVVLFGADFQILHNALDRHALGKGLHR